MQTADIYRRTLMSMNDRVHSWMSGLNRDDKGPRELINSVAPINTIIGLASFANRGSDLEFRSLRD